MMKGHFFMHPKHKTLGAGLAAGLLAAGLGAAALSGTAQASTPGCAFTNGCATLHGIDAGGSAVAMDAKYQSSKTGTLIIGYPDKPGDGATTFAGVLHETPGKKVVTYQDTGLQVRDFDNTCNTAAGHNVTPTVTGNGLATGTITAGGSNTLSASSSVADLSVNGGGTPVLSWTGAANGVAETLIVAENYGAGCVSLWGSDVSATGGGTHVVFTPFTVIASSSGGHIHETDTGSSVDTFTDTVSGGTFTFTALPKGVSQAGGVLTADSSTAIPGTYTSVGVVYTEPGGVVDTASFTLVISGVKSVSPGTPTPYYTFAYAKGGDWTSQCVTNVNGSGSLILAPCTLGKDHYQDFYALNSAGVPQGDLLTNGGGTYHIQNFLAAYGSPSSCLADTATVNPATPETNAFDTAIGGRQLRVNASCTASATEWSWSS